MNKPVVVQAPQDPAKDTLKPPADKIKVVFIGDIMLSRGIAYTIKKQQQDYRFPFLLVKDFLSSADLVFANLENPVSYRGHKVGSMYSFRADPLAMEGLRYANIGLVSIANNHIWDYGREAFVDTMQNLSDAGISFIGGGADYQSAHTPVIKEIKGTKIAFLGYTNLIPKSITTENSQPAVSFLDEDVLQSDILKAKGEADLVVVSFHWGDEYRTTHNVFQERVAKLAIDAGADLVIGHHPHVPEEVEKYKSGYIVYSLGNFVFDQNFSPDTSHGLVVTADIADKQITNLETNMVDFNGLFQPYLKTP